MKESANSKSLIYSNPLYRNQQVISTLTETVQATKISCPSGYAVELVLLHLECTLTLWLYDITPVHVVSRVLFHATEGIPLPVQPVSQERVEYVCV